MFQYSIGYMGDRSWQLELYTMQITVTMSKSQNIMQRNFHRTKVPKIRCS